MPGISFFFTALDATEGGAVPRTYTVVLDTMPTSNVTVGITNSSSADVTTSASSLTFTTGNWNSPQRVTVTAVDDKIDEATEVVTLTHTASGGGYDSVTDAVTFNVYDNDMRDVTVSPTSLPINEGGSGTYTVKLNTQPRSGVTVTINDPTDNTDVTADPASLTFLHNQLGYRRRRSPYGRPRTATPRRTRPP